MADEHYFNYVIYSVKIQLILSGIKYSYTLCVLNVMYMNYFISKMYFFSLLLYLYNCRFQAQKSGYLSPTKVPKS